MGGMPELLFLALSFGCVYFLFRLATTREFQHRPLALLAKFVVAFVLGFALSAFLLLPFLEYITMAHDSPPSRQCGRRKNGIRR